MPASYWNADSDYFRDPLARYKEAGLFENLVPLVGANWFANAA